MLADKFVEVEVKRWLQEARPNIYNPVEFLPNFAMHIIKAYEEYRKLVSVDSR